MADSIITYMERTVKMAAAFQQEKAVTIRCNRAKATPEELKEALEREGVSVEPHPYLSSAFRIKGYDYLKGFALETIVTAILFSMIGYFNGHDKTIWVMAQGLIQTLLVRLPLAYYMSIQPDASLTKIGFAAPAATIFGILLNVVYLIFLKYKKRI